MNIVVDCFKLIKGVGKSIGIYNVAVAIVQGLSSVIVLEESDDKVIVIGNSFNRKDFDKPGVLFREIRDYDPGKKADLVYWELFGVNRYLRECKADVALFPRGFAPVKCVVRDVVIIHDMIPFYYDEFFPGVFNPVENFYIKKRLKASARKAFRVITISEASKNDIVKYTGINESRVKVIHNHCRIGDLKKKDGGERYILAVTSDLPHKNAKAIINAYDAYFKLASDPVKLVIIGIAESIGYGASSDISPKIECHKYIDDARVMKEYIRNASVFLFLSLKEGFGLPPLEAMAEGTPVVCSNLSSLPEVVGEAGILVDPDDSYEIAVALNRVLTDEMFRERLVLLGYENCKRFDADRAANEYYSFLKEIVEAEK